MEDLIILGKVIQISDDLEIPGLSANHSFFINVVIEIHKVLGGRGAVLYKSIYDTSKILDDERPNVVVVSFATAWESPIKFELDQVGIFTLTVSGRKKMFYPRNFEPKLLNQN